jgi:hypothetical protein
MELKVASPGVAADISSKALRVSLATLPEGRLARIDLTESGIDALEKGNNRSLHPLGFN